MTLVKQDRNTFIFDHQVEVTESLLSTIKKMDLLDSKLLIVTENKRYKTLLSIGDIQRAIIKGSSLDAAIATILGRKVKVCHINDSPEYIKAEILKYRMEFMPVLNENDELVDVVLWQDVLSNEDLQLDLGLNIPVVIMAGGKGTRLKPLTNIIPKPLVPLGEKPIIEIIVDRFVATGVKQFYFSVNYKAEMIQRFFDELPDKKYEIEYFSETKPLGTAGSLHLLKHKLHTTFFVSNCDILINQDYNEIYKYHVENKNELTLVAALKHYPIPYGTLEVGEEGLLKDLKEKPELTFMVNAGMYILEPHLLNEVPEDDFFHITHLIDKIKDRGGRVGVFPVSEGSWMDIGEWKEYNQTMQRLGLDSIVL
jgi:dTDP-glucose pyrophosphorylase